MSLLIDKLPTYVTINGQRYDLNTDFRYYAMFESMMFDDDLTDQEKLEKALKLCYKNAIPSDLNAAVDKLLWFYHCGKEEKKRSSRKSAGNKRVYDFEFDDALIFSAFRQQYGVDLHEEEIHWWKFKAMMQNLSDNTEFVKVMSYRAIEITSSMTKSQKEFYQDMKRIHALPTPTREARENNAIVEALLNGGDLSKLNLGGAANAGN